MKYGFYCKTLYKSNIADFIDKIYKAPERINVDAWLNNFSLDQKIKLFNKLKDILKNSISDKKIKKIFEKELSHDVISYIIDFIDLQEISYNLMSNICYNLEKTCQI